MNLRRPRRIGESGQASHRVEVQEPLRPSHPRRLTTSARVPAAQTEVNRSNLCRRPYAGLTPGKPGKMGIGGRGPRGARACLGVAALGVLLILPGLSIPGATHQEPN